jgi:2'-5' RNA ligase
MLKLESALVILVPEAERLVGAFRNRYDSSAAQGAPAHITVLYPFKPPGEINSQIEDDLRQLFSKFASFQFALSRLCRFSAEALYLAPEPDEPFRQLTIAACKYSPDTPQYEGQYAEIVPHLTVATLHDDVRLDEIAREFEDTARDGLPLKARAERVALLDTRSGRWETRATFELATNDRDPG